LFSTEPFNQWFSENVRCPLCRYDIRNYNPNSITNNITNSYIEEHEIISENNTVISHDDDDDDDNDDDEDDEDDEDEDDDDDIDIDENIMDIAENNDDTSLFNNNDLESYSNTIRSSMLNNSIYDEEYNLEDVSTDDIPTDAENSPIISPHTNLPPTLEDDEDDELNNMRTRTMESLELFFNSQLRQMTTNISNLDPNIQVVSEARVIYGDNSGEQDTSMNNLN